MLPAITIHRILKRNGRIKPESAVRLTGNRFARGSCNELAQMDFKGDYRLADGGKCYPLTLLDDCSRYLLGLWPLASLDGTGVYRVLKQHSAGGSAAGNAHGPRVNVVFQQHRTRADLAIHLAHQTGHHDQILGSASSANARESRTVSSNFEGTHETSW